MNKEVETNRRIRDREVRVIGHDGAQLGIMSSYDALRRAEELSLDLVKISPTANPPVCKIMDYGKYKFDQSKKEKDARKNQKTSELKEISLSMTIEDHDLKTKAGHAHKFLARGDKCKVNIRMKGRQQTHSKLGIGVMDDFFALVEDVGVVEKKPTVEGRNILMILVPKNTSPQKPKSAAPPAEDKPAAVEIRKN